MRHAVTWRHPDCRSRDGDDLAEIGLESLSGAKRKATRMPREEFDLILVPVNDFDRIVDPESPVWQRHWMRPFSGSGRHGGWGFKPIGDNRC